MGYMSNLKMTVAKHLHQHRLQQKPYRNAMPIFAGDFINECGRGQQQCSKGSVKELFRDKPPQSRYLEKLRDIKLYNKVRNTVAALRRKLQREDGRQKEWSEPTEYDFCPLSLGSYYEFGLFIQIHTQVDDVW